MFSATKGHVRLEVKLNDEIRITPFVLMVELKFTANAIAKSIRSILNVQLKGVAKRDKEPFAREYFEGKGWLVENSKDSSS